MMQSDRAWRVALLGVGLCCGATAKAATWGPATGVWGNSANWSGGDVPDVMADVAEVSTGVATLDGDYSIGGLTLGAGGIDGIGNLTATSLTSTDGELRGTGTLTVTGTASILGNTSTVALLLRDDRTLKLTGTTTQTARTSGIFGYETSKVINTGTYVLANNSGFVAVELSTFRNAGLVTKTGGTGSSTLSGLINTGTVLAKSGRIYADLAQLGGTYTSTGTFGTTGTGQLTLTGAPSHTLSSSVTFTGSGVELRGTVVAGGAISAAPGSSVAFSGSAITGDHDWTFDNFTWSHGTLTGSGALTVTGTATLRTSPFEPNLTGGRTLKLTGTTIQSTSDTYGLILGGGKVHNSGDYRVTNDSGVGHIAADDVFTNTGTLTKTRSPGTAYFSNIVTTGTVASQSGTLLLRLKENSTNSGAYAAYGTGTLALTATNTATIDAAAIFIGDGTIVFGSEKIAGNGSILLRGSHLFESPVAISHAILRTDGSKQTFTTLEVNPGGRLDVSTGELWIESGTAAWPEFTRSLLADPSTTGIFTSAADAHHRLGYRAVGGSMRVKYTVNGDTDLDGGVSINDFNALAARFGRSTGQTWADGDFDYDGGVSIHDFNLLASGFAHSVPAGSNAWAGLLAFAAAHDDLVAFEAVTGIPEPACVALGVIGSALLGRRRRAVR